MSDTIASRSKAAPELVRDGVRDSIIRGDYPAGHQLRQDEIADKFGTSRIPVREALRQLEAEGFVVISPNKGAVVRARSIHDIIELFDIRIALECRALKLSIPNLAIEDIESAREILKEYQSKSDDHGWPEMNWNFHWTIYSPCNRPNLVSMIEANFGHVNMYLRSQSTISTSKQRPLKQHVDLLDLCEHGDVGAAVSMLEHHIEQTQKSLRAAHRRSIAPRGASYQPENSDL